MQLARMAAVLLLVLISGAVSAQSDADRRTDMEAVGSAVLAYIDGIMAGDAERVAGVLHPEFHKTGILTIRETGRQCLRSSGRSQQVAAVGAQGEQVGKEDRDIEIRIL
ncbi:hypothetical protein ACFL6T_06915, partial [Candidatus Zixiibacteriota bacterium]